MGCISSSQEDNPPYRLRTLSQLEKCSQIELIVANIEIMEYILDTFIMIPNIWQRMTEVAYLWVSVSLYVSIYCIVLWWAQGPSLSYLSPWNSAFLVFGLQFMGVFFSLLISDFWFGKNGEWRLMNTMLGWCLYAGWLYVGWCIGTITAKCRFLWCNPHHHWVLISDRPNRSC